ncbi:MAG: FAD:protein FMN transferase [Micrococcales bacterium]|nr:FAD:protein FMN transferase [Micrococcales bacterium]
MNEFRHVELCMGTAFQYFGRTDLADQKLTEAIRESVAALHNADNVFSLYKPDSPLSQLARGEVSIAELPEIVSFIWDECERWSELTDGWFSSMTNENTFDPSGLVKAWATEVAANKLEEFGITDFAINAGGDIRLSKNISSGKPKRIGITKPVSITETNEAITVIDLNDTEFFAVATSGTAERGNHIWNSKEQKPADDFLQVTVVAKDIITADVLATAIFAAGNQAETLITKFANQIEVLIINSAKETFSTPGFSKLISPV